MEVTKWAPKKSSMIFNMGNKIPDWLSKSCVGVLRSFDFIPDIDSIVAKKFVGVEARVLGGHQMVITFPTIEQRLVTFNGDHTEWIGQYFRHGRIGLLMIYQKEGLHGSKY
ncbi:hypothetical protein ACFE04_010542 [Oxalis oulophora]